MGMETAMASGRFLQTAQQEQTEQLQQTHDLTRLTQVKVSDNKIYSSDKGFRLDYNKSMFFLNLCSSFCTIN